jgi:hypothetical protein
VRAAARMARKNKILASKSKTGGQFPLTDDLVSSASWQGD